MASSEVTAVIKAKDEQDKIHDCVKAAFLLAAEVIVVVDPGTTDNTSTVAAAAGATVVLGRPHGGRIDLLDKQGFESVDGGWIVRLDADEFMSASLAATLRLIAARDEAEGVRFARRNYFFGDWLRHGGWYTHDQLRFFKADAWDRSWSADLHTQVPVAGRIITLAGTSDSTEHYDYSRVEQFVTRSLLHYASREARDRDEAGRPFRNHHLLTMPARKLLGRLIVRKAYKDGSRGMLVALLLATYEFYVNAYRWQTKRSRMALGSDSDPRHNVRS